jgi:hypothetical protein
MLQILHLSLGFVTDSAFSGGSMERPALKRLLADSLRPGALTASS